MDVKALVGKLDDDDVDLFSSEKIREIETGRRLVIARSKMDSALTQLEIRTKERLM